jgi:hypothetical protein
VTLAAVVGGAKANASETEAVEGGPAHVAVVVDTAAVGRLAGAVVVKADILEVATAATFEVEVAAAIVGVSGRFAVAIVVVPDENATSAFPDKSIQKRLGSVRTARSARPRTLARYGIGRVLCMARTRFVSR